MRPVASGRLCRGGYCSGMTPPKGYQLADRRSTPMLSADHPPTETGIHGIPFDLWSGLSSGDPAAEIGVLGIPFDNATCFRKGAFFGPAKIRELTPYLVPATEEGYRLAGLRVRDYGDVEADLHWERFFAAVEALATRVLQHPFALFLGGDHSVTIPLTAAFSQVVDGQFGVIHFDAHPDLADEYQGHRWSHACTQRRVLELANIEPRHLVCIGLRSWIDDELDFLAQHPRDWGPYSPRYLPPLYRDSGRRCGGPTARRGRGLLDARHRRPGPSLCTRYRHARAWRSVDSPAIGVDAGGLCPAACTRDGRRGGGPSSGLCRPCVVRSDQDDL